MIPKHNSRVIDLLEQREVVNSTLNDWIDQARRRVDWDKAIYLCSQSRTVASQSEDDSEFCCAMIEMYEGALHHSMGDLAEAAECYSRSQEGFSHVDSCDTVWNAAIACYARGLVYQSQGRWADALSRFNQAQKIIKNSKNPKAHVGVERIHQRVFYLHDRYHQQRLQEDLENSIPVVGTTSAGYPMLAIPLPNDDVLPDKIYIKGRVCLLKHMLEPGRGDYSELLSGKDQFVVQVEGESMTAIGIDDGDYVVFRRQAEVVQGEIAVVRIDYADGARSTIKRFYRSDAKIRLMAENPAFQPHEQIFGKSDPTLHILGKAIAVLCTNTEA